MARIAMIIADMFEDREFRVPYDTLRNAGHEVVLIGTVGREQIRGKQHKETVTTERAVRDVAAEDFAALVIPGGYSPDHLRMDPDMVALVREFAISGKPVAAVCHAPWMLAEANVARGRTVTSWPSIRTDLINAGAKWIDREVVEDGNLITSRKPEDLEAFCQAILRRVPARDQSRESARSRAEATTSMRR